MAEKEKPNPVDLAGIGNLLEHLIATDSITCEERNRIILRIAKENSLAEYMLHGFVGYGQSKDEVLEHIAHRKASAPQGKEQDALYFPYRDCPSRTVRMRQNI